MIAFRRVAPLVLGALLVACEDDPTGPSVVDLLAANSLDALARSRIGEGDGFGANATRAAALALRAGIRPARVSITVDGVREQYWALEVEHAFADDLTESVVLELPIVTRTMVAWRGVRPERVISITVHGDTGTFAWPIYTALELPPERPLVFSPSVGLMFERGSPTFHAVDGGGRSTRQAIGAECRLPRAPDTPTITSVIPPPTCRTATFFTRFNMRVVEGPVPGPAAVRTRVVEMGAHDVPGIRLEYPTFQCIAC